MASSIAPHQPFLAFAKDEQDRETLKQFAATHGWADSCVMEGDITAAIQLLKENPSPSLLLVEIPSANEAKSLLDGLAEVCAPDTKVIVIGAVNEYSFFCWLMEIGISSYLLKPMTEEALETAYLKSMTQGSGQTAEAKRPGKVIACIGARGGVGATTLALSLAGIIAEFSKKNTALVDLDPQESTVALTLDLEPGHGFREALEKPDRIDSLFIERVMHKYGKHLSLLSSEETLQERVAIHDMAADALLKELKEKFDVIVLDVPRHLNAFHRKCLAQAEQVVLVGELTLTSLRDTLRLSDMIRETFKLKAPIVIANRVGLSKQAVTPADFEKGINAKIDYSVPFAPDLFMQVSSEIPALKSKGHAAVKPLLQLAMQLVPETKIAGVEAKPEKKKGGMFKRDAKPEKAKEPEKENQEPEEDVKEAKKA